MRKILLAAAVMLLAACGSSGNGVSVGTSGDKTSNTSASGGGAGSTEGSEATESTEASSESTEGVTIPVKNLGDMPPECISLLSDFLKQIEPVVSKVDWNKATINDLESLGDQFQAESDKFDTEAAAKGCDKYDLQTSDEKTLQQLEALAANVAPGTVGFIHYIGSFAASTSDTTPVAAGDCDSIIAQIEPYISSGKTIKDLTLSDATKVGSLLSQVYSACPADKATAFFEREDVQTFAGG